MMPFKRITRGPLIEVVGEGNCLPMHLMVEAAVLKIIFEPPANFKTPVAADCDVTEIKQPVNIRT